MEPTQAQNLARQFLPAGSLPHARSASLGLTPVQARAVDLTPEDGSLSRADLASALTEHRLEVGSDGRLATATASFDFVEPALQSGGQAVGPSVGEPWVQPLSQASTSPLTEPLAESGTESASESIKADQAGPELASLIRPEPDLFPGYGSLSMRDPVSQPLHGKESAGSYYYPQNYSLAQLNHAVQSPDQVARLLWPYGSVVYDKDRYQNHTGPIGAQSPQSTWEQ